MPDPILRPCKAADIFDVNDRDHGTIERTMLSWQASMGPSFTLELEGRVLGCAGIMVCWPGVGMVWMIVSDEIDQWGLTMTRHVRQVIKDTVRHFNLHRLEASALCDIEKYGRWLTLLGFTQERDGIAHAYLPDRRSIRRYEWVKGTAL